MRLLVLFFVLVLFAFYHATLLANECAEVVRAELTHSIPRTDQEKAAYLKKFEGQIRALARQIARPDLGLDAEDLVSVGNLAILETLEKFDPTRGPNIEQFSYAIAHKAMLWERSAHNLIPPDLLAKVTRLHKAESNFANENGRMPTESELAKELNTSVEQIRKIRVNETANIKISLETTVHSHTEKDTGDASLSSLIADPNSKSPLDEILEKEAETLRPIPENKPKIIVPASAQIDRINITQQLKNVILGALGNLYPGQKAAFIRSLFLLEPDTEIARKVGLADVKSVRDQRNGAIRTIRAAIKDKQPDKLQEFDDFISSRSDIRKTESVPKLIRDRVESVVNSRISGSDSHFDPEFKGHLEKAILNLNDRDREIFLRTVVNHEPDEDVIRSLSLNGNEILNLSRKNAFGSLRNYFKSLPAEHSNKLNDELENFLKTRTQLRKNTFSQDIKNQVALAIESSQIRNKSPEFKAKLTEALGSHQGHVLQILVRTVIGNESDEVVAQSLGFTEKKLSLARADALKEIRRYFKSLTKEQFDELDSYLKSRVRERKAASSMNIKIKGQVTSALESAQNTQMSPQFKENLGKAISANDGAALEISTRTIIGNDSNEAVARSLGYEVKKVEQMRKHLLSRLRLYFKSQPKEESEELEAFLKKKRQIRNSLSKDAD